MRPGRSRLCTRWKPRLSSGRLRFAFELWQHRCFSPSQPLPFREDEYGSCIASRTWCGFVVLRRRAYASFTSASCTHHDSSRLRERRWSLHSMARFSGTQGQLRCISGRVGLPYSTDLGLPAPRADIMGSYRAHPWLVPGWGIAGPWCLAKHSGLLLWRCKAPCSCVVAMIYWRTARPLVLIARRGTHHRCGFANLAFIFGFFAPVLWGAYYYRVWLLLIGLSATQSVTPGSPYTRGRAKAYEPGPQTLTWWFPGGGIDPGPRRSLSRNS